MKIVNSLFSPVIVFFDSSFNLIKSTVNFFSCLLFLTITTIIFFFVIEVIKIICKMIRKKTYTSIKFTCIEGLRRSLKNVKAIISIILNIGYSMEEININDSFDHVLKSHTFKNEAYSKALDEKKEISNVIIQERAQLYPDQIIGNDSLLKKAFTCCVCLLIVKDPKECPSC